MGRQKTFLGSLSRARNKPFPRPDCLGAALPDGAYPPPVNTGSDNATRRKRFPAWAAGSIASGRSYKTFVLGFQSRLRASGGAQKRVSALVDLNKKTGLSARSMKLT